ncbi:dicarboxylic amino acid permease [Ceratobasidium sp. AG-Ba]|nr:dicarboxylic amino acid permease [Ceratobasidium sp. AG-Ba]
MVSTTRSLAFVSSVLVVIFAYAYIISPELLYKAFSSVAHLNFTATSPTRLFYETPNKSQKMSAQSISRNVVKKVYAAETPEGAGAVVRRSIGSMSLRNLSPFLIPGTRSLTPGSGFPDHPHRGQATVTYMIEGSSQHEDSAGHKGTLGPGDVQWMIAGKGIVHAEMPLFGPDDPNPMGMQLWIDLPKEHKMTTPTYQELNRSQIPSAFPESPDGPIEIKIISGKSFGVESPVKHLGGCWYMDFQFKASDATVFQELPSGWTAFLYILKGSLKVNNSESHDHFHTLVLSSGPSENGVTITSTSPDARAVLIAGEPLDQTVVQYGPFVMTTREEIQQTLRDYSTGQNGFENAHLWKSKIGSGMM